jgi:hypothetical protein
MNQTKLTFASEKFVVDWISFKFQNWDKEKEQQITSYLLKMGFNSFQTSGKLALSIKESLRINQTNQFEVLLVKDGPYWKGTTVNFSGKNAAIFYKLIQENQIDWEIFSSGVLNRFDLFYNRKIQKSEKSSLRNFFENCHKKVIETKKSSSLDKTQKGWLLSVGNRRSPKYFRIYETENSIKFEFERKGKFLQNYHTLLISNQLDELEGKLSSEFLVSFGKLLPLDSSFLDWLVVRLRPIRKQTTLLLGLNSDYIRSEIIADPKNFIRLLQFLSYAVDLNFKNLDFDGVAYRQVVFEIQDFLKFQNLGVKSGNHYQLKKVKDFFMKLQSGVLITSFSENYFRSLIGIPKVELTKCPIRKSWFARVSLVEELCLYRYPFNIPNLFQKKLTSLEFKVRVQFLQVFSSVSLEKTFFIEQFFQSYGSTLSNQNKSKIKKEFIQIVEFFQTQKLIENNFKVLSNGSYRSVEKLTIQNISEGFLIYEKLDF